MRISITLMLALFVLSDLVGQTKQLSFSLEYTPNYSIITNEFTDEQYKLSHSTYIKVNFSLSNKTQVYTGLGYMNAGEQEKRDLYGQLGVKSVQYKHNNNYLVVPIGLKYKLNKYFVAGELIIAHNLSNRLKYVKITTDEERQVTWSDDDNNMGNWRKLILPIAVSVGRVWNIRNARIITGFQFYYSLNTVMTGVPRKGHHKSYGILLGFEI